MILNNKTIKLKRLNKILKKYLNKLILLISLIRIIINIIIRNILILVNIGVMEFWIISKSFKNLNKLKSKKRFNNYKTKLKLKFNQNHRLYKN